MKHKSAYRIRARQDMTKLETHVGGTWVTYVGSQAKLVLSGREIYDAVYGLRGGYPPPVRQEYQSRPEAREAYLDLFTPVADFRLGLQTVVWGTADGLKVNDFVNPLDFTEIIFNEEEELRLPVAMLKAQKYIGSFTLEGLWDPHVRFSKLPIEGSEFELRKPAPTPGVTLREAPPDKPGNGPQNSQGGFRLGYSGHGWDGTLLYFDRFSDLPAFFQSVEVDSQTGLPTLVTQQNFPRQRIVGSSFSSVWRGLELRSEWASFDPEYVRTEPFPPLAEFVPKRTLAWTVEVGRQITPWLYQSGQIFSRRILSEPSFLAEPRVQNFVTFYTKLKFLQEKLKPECFALIGLTGQGSWVRPKWVWEAADHINIVFGIDFFTGSPDSLLGQFSGRDRGFLEVKYSF